MTDAAQATLDEATRRMLFGELGVPEGTVGLDNIEDLNGFENFVFGVGNRVIRITHDSHRSGEQISAELDFIHYLASGGAPVARPLPSPGGLFLYTQGGFHACQFERALGSRLELRPFDDQLVRAWGRAIGLFHKLAIDYKGSAIRPDWLRDANHQFADRIPGAEVDVLAQAENMLARLALLPGHSETFGLIHSDAHAGNFLHQDGELSFFDFDDCLYAWFGYDVATILFGVVLQPHVDDTEAARVAAVDEFLPVFLEGYADSYDVHHLMWPSMQDFLQLREFSLYGVIHAYMDPENLTDWYPRKFMAGRRGRLEQGLPFVDIDFASRYG